MRMSTAGMHHNALTAMLTQQATLSKTQTQIASGKRIQTPADDPIGAVHLMELQRALQESDQFRKNADAATNRLTLEEQALADAGTVLQRVRELTLQASNATVDPASRRMIATEVRARLQELTDIANRRDAGGEHLFSGYATLTQPFVLNAGTVTYQGDQGGRSLQVGPTQRVTDSHSGYQLFMDIPEGNGTFVTDSGAGNTGTGVIASGSVTNPALWVPDDYTLRFTSATGDYEILDSSAAVVTTGTYTAGDTISFNGVAINMSGQPVLNDTFTISRSRTEDVFTTLSNLITTLEAPGITQQQRAQFQTDIGRALQQLDQTGEHLIGIRGEAGARLSSLDGITATLDDHSVELQRMSSQLADLDYAEAITRMNQQLVGLQAAQASYTQIAQLSLFNYWR
jgi:flagellar hook-associated protein 3 FlgL